MLLKSLEIKNYRSLEHVKLDNMQLFNVLIGRNNAGKSSVFQAFYNFVRSFVSIDALNPTQAINMPTDVLTNRDTTRQLEINLDFTFRNHERADFIDELIVSGFDRQRKDELQESHFLSEIHFFFKSAVGNPGLIHLRETKILAEDGKWATIQQMIGNDQIANPKQRSIHLGAYSRELGEKKLYAEMLRFEKIHTNFLQEIDIVYNRIFHESWIGDSATRWLYIQLGNYFRNAFFFNPIRRSKIVMGMVHSDILAQDGDNLVQVLNTLRLNGEDTFDAIQRFIQGALPDIGRLRTPSIPGTNQTNIEFQVSPELAPIQLAYMGGGVEQLLMVAAVLLMTKTQHNTIFLEEPESHLHAGAQRYLMEQLRAEDRQVFITTHSPTFINVVEPFSLYQVVNTDGRTTIRRCDADALDAVFEDIGVRNSDVLLSDAIVFVEGKSDSDTLTALSEKIGMSLASKNINILLMNGGRYAHRTAPVRSELLEDISGKSPVPHLFLLDRDERGEDEIQRLETRLQNKVHFFKMRELENYLLAPRAILEALASKYANNPPMLKKLASTTKDHIAQVISEAADSLYPVVLLKRIRTRIGGLQDGLLPTESLSKLLPYAKEPDLGSLVRKEIAAQCGRYITEMDIESIVSTIKLELGLLWSDPENRLILAPGQEILETVYKAVGSGYKKTEDAVRIAREMEKEEIPQEIKEVIYAAYNLIK